MKTNYNLLFAVFLVCIIVYFSSLHAYKKEGFRFRETYNKHNRSLRLKMKPYIEAAKAQLHSIVKLF